MITVSFAQPTEFRVYHIRNESGESLYVGQSINPFRRISEHAKSKRPNPAFWEYLQACDLDSLLVDMYTLGECEAETGESGQDAVNVMESKLILRFNPPFNKNKLVIKYQHERSDRFKFSCDFLSL